MKFSTVEYIVMIVGVQTVAGPHIEQNNNTMEVNGDQKLWN